MRFVVMVVGSGLFVVVLVDVVVMLVGDFVFCGGGDLLGCVVE